MMKRERFDAHSLQWLQRSEVVEKMPHFSAQEAIVISITLVNIQY
jgi:hypothetical protein